METRRFAGLRTGLLFGVIILGLGVGAWAATVSVMRKPLPKPLYTAHDLPPLPPPAYNGWTLVARAAREVTLPELPRAVTRICGDRKPEDRARWDAAVAQADTLAGIAAAAGPGMAQLKAMAARPAFVQTCMPKIKGKACLLMAFAQLHHVAEATALAAATDHRLADALNDTASLLALDRRDAVSSRSLLGQLMALDDLGRSLRLVTVLLADPAAGDWQDPVVAPALAAVGHQIDAFDPQDIDIRRGVIFEYLTLQSAIGLLETTMRGKLHQKVGPLAVLFYDPADTRRRIDVYFRRLTAFAAHPGPKAPPPMAPQAQGPFWWLYNPVGKKLLDTSILDVGKDLVWQHQSLVEVTALMAKVRHDLARRQGPTARRMPPPAAPPSPPAGRRR